MPILLEVITMSQHNISNSDWSFDHRADEARLSNLSGSDRNQTLRTFVNTNEDDDFSLQAEFDSSGCVRDIEIIV